MNTPIPTQPTEVELTEKQIGIISHSLGINYYHALRTDNPKYKTLPEDFYRNYYNYSVFDSDMEVLKDLNLIECYRAINLDCFCVTEKGIELFREIFKKEVTDKAPKISAAKLKYREFVESDHGWDFKDWLGIEPPKREYKDGLVRLVSTKYRSVKGEYKRLLKDAKASYKEALAKYKTLIKD